MEKSDLEILKVNREIPLQHTSYMKKMKKKVISHGKWNLFNKIYFGVVLKQLLFIWLREGFKILIVIKGEFVR